MSLFESYDAAVSYGDIENDPAQRMALSALQTLSETLANEKKTWFSFKKSSIKGVYLFGPVGAGKTYLMDLFFADTGFKSKMRFHLHHFMQQIDAQLRHLQGKKNPIEFIAKQIAQLTRVLCFDEFIVNDVAHAMILAELIKYLFKNGVVLVATSNTDPEHLYKDGPQRRRFLPAIMAIKQQCVVINIENKKDHRLNRRHNGQTWFYPLTEKTRAKMSAEFMRLSHSASMESFISVQNRKIACLACEETKGIVWFDFKAICNLPRSQLDYLEIANRFDTIFISDIPALTEKHTIFAILLIHFVDVMYDRGIRLIMSAEVPVEQLYVQGEMAVEFKRTQSRLQEMQSADYLKRHPHEREKNLPLF